MTEWIKCTENLPTSKRDPRIVSFNDDQYKILISINGRYFTAIARTINSCYIHLTKEIVFDMNTQKWIMPLHYRDPDYWMEIPEIPND